MMKLTNIFKKENKKASTAKIEKLETTQLKQVIGGTAETTVVKTKGNIKDN